MGVTRTRPCTRPGVARSVYIGRGAADCAGSPAGGIRQSGGEAPPEKADFGYAGSRGLRSDDEMRASAVRHAAETFPRTRSVGAASDVLVGLRLSRARSGARLSAAHGGRAALSSGKGQAPCYSNVGVALIQPGLMPDHRRLGHSSESPL